MKPINNKLLNKILLYSLGKIIPALFGIVGITVFTRLLGEKNFGIFSLIITAITFLRAVLFEWLDRAWLRYFSNGNSLDMELRNSVYRFILKYILFQSVFGFILINYVPIPGFDDQLKLMALVILLLEGGYQFILIQKVARKSSRVYTLYSILYSSVKFILAFILITYWGFQVGGMLAGIIIAGALIILINTRFIWSRRDDYFKVGKNSRSTLSPFIRYGLPWSVMSFATIILAQGDRFILNYYINPETVGIYAANYNLVNVSIQLITAVVVMVAYPPIMASFDTVDNQNIVSGSLIRKYVSLYFLFVIPAGVFLSLYAKPILGLFLSSSFNTMSGYIYLIIIGSGFYGLTHLSYKTFELSRNINKLIFLCGLATLLNIGLNIVWIPKFGIFGAALATCLSFIAYFLFTYIIGKKYVAWSINYFFTAKVIGSVLLATIVTTRVFQRDCSSLALIPALLIFCVTVAISLFIISKKEIHFLLQFEDAKPQ